MVMDLDGQVAKSKTKWGQVALCLLAFSFLHHSCLCFKFGGIHFLARFYSLNYLA